MDNYNIIFFQFQLLPNVTQDNGHAVLTSSTTQTAFQVIIGVIKKSIVMTSQMNKIAVSISMKLKSDIYWIEKFAFLK